jgi:cysteinyl-tRNA synthetase
MTFKIKNSLGNKLEEFKPLNEKEVGLYTCGPTVYNYAHIGNFRAYIFEDLLKRHLLFLGYNVKHVMNLTDVDDKTIKGSISEGISLFDFTKKYKDAFFEDIKKLNILPADIYPSATEEIGEMVKIIEKLTKKGLAYRGEDDSIYFSIKKFPEYGKLAGIDTSKLKSGARIKQDEYEKEGIGDFALWKAYNEEEDGPVHWQTSLGKGRPGWHIECSAMSSKYLGDSFDIHCGGVDNKFPHHENEIAQSEGANEKPFVKYWMHCEHLMVDGEKMSKSKGNFYTLRDLLDKGLDAKAIRFTLLNSQYRQPLNFTIKSVEDNTKAINGLNETIRKLLSNNLEGNESDLINDLINETKNKFINGLNDDLNAPLAISSIFEFNREINKLLDSETITKKDSEKIIEFYKDIDRILGVLEFEKEEVELTEKQISLIKEREEARKNKDFAKSDTIRDKLKAEGITLVDNKDGTTTAKKE